MSRSKSLQLLCVFLFVLAGCAGGSQFPAELDQNDIEDHRNLVTAADSYTVFTNTTTRTDGQLVRTTDIAITRNETENRTRLELSESRLTQAGGSGELSESRVIAEYRSNGERAIRQGVRVPTGEIQYRTAYEAAADTDTPAPPSLVGTNDTALLTELGDATLERNGTAEYRGETVGVYTADRAALAAVKNETDEWFREGSVGNVSDFDELSLTVYLTRDGLLTYQAVSFERTVEGRVRSGEIRTEVRGPNGTSVSEPDWVPAAREGAQTEATPTPRPSVGTVPQAAFEFDFDHEAGTVDVTHAGGDILQVGDNTDRVYITSTDSSASAATWVGADGAAVAAGDSYEGYTYGEAGATVRVVWNGPENETTATIASEQAPT